MTIENISFFIAGVSITGIGFYLANLTTNFKEAADQESEKVLAKSMSTQGINPTTTAPSPAYASKSASSSSAAWTGNHFPRLEDMF